MSSGTIFFHRTTYLYKPEMTGKYAWIAYMLALCDYQKYLNCSPDLTFRLGLAKHRFRIPRSVLRADKKSMRRWQGPTLC